MNSLQKFESGEELSDEQLMSINGGTNLTLSGPQGTVSLSVGSNGVTLESNGFTGSATTTVGLNGVSTTREGLAPLDANVPLPI